MILRGSCRTGAYHSGGQGNGPDVYRGELEGRNVHGAAAAVGNYEVTVSAPGFEAFHQTSATLDVAQRLGINVTLVVGAATDTVIIAGGPSITVSSLVGLAI